ncbi:MAG: hypothetical protein JO314_13600 [Acidobacteria bacterium]|nr:hypothetical protein [Acidobacteriota bacterium]
MTRSKVLLCIALGVVAFAGCRTVSSSSNNANSALVKVVNSNSSSNSNANSNSAANTATANDPGNAAGSPTDVYKAAYTARKNCDLADLKKVFSRELIKFMSNMAKEDKKSLDDELKDLCSRPQGSTEQVRNEKINGAHASIEYLDENNEWQHMDFIKEDGAWRMSLGAPGEDAPEPNRDDKDDNRS